MSTIQTRGRHDANAAAPLPTRRWPRRLLGVAVLLAALVALAPLLAVLGAVPHERIDTEVTIAAGADEVWAVLADLDAYGSWNPFMREAAGTLTPGEHLEIDLTPPGGPDMTIRPRVLVAEPGRELRWLGRLGVPGLIDGEHAFVLHPQPDESTRLVHTEDFRGLAVPLLRARMLEPTRAGFEAMNAALAARVDGG